MRSRRFLKYSFAFAYYCFDSFETIRRENFEHYQHILEMITENLQEMTERPPLNKLETIGIKNQVEC